MAEKQFFHHFGKRKDDSHKGDYGRVLVVAGSEGFAGAAFLATKGALRAGSGLVTLGVPRGILAVMETKLTCAMTHGFSETPEHTFSAAAVAEVLEFAADFDAVALGPGISTHPETVKFVCELVPKLEKPLVLDADGLNAIAREVDKLTERKHPTVLTPHPGELKRIASDPKAQTEAGLKNFAEKYNNVLVLKRHRTLVTCGKRVYINITGNPGMATGGSGDVLTGIIASFLGRKIEPFKAAASAVYLHGLAGDIAAEHLTMEALIATDILAYMPHAWKRYLEEIG
jgi:NAD(P)H-hydrate epimerase